jgi:hypothetical protein
MSNGLGIRLRSQVVLRFQRVERGQMLIRIFLRVLLHRIQSAWEFGRDES